MCFGLSPFGGTGRGLWYSFDAWGRRRSANDWNYTLDANDQPLFAGRGFTGHEFLSDFNLYNMNGRLYDPVVGRFLSPDPVIQDPLATQEYNRYSYCLNNPLKYSDPTGYKKAPKLEGFDWAYIDYMTRRFSSWGNGTGGGYHTYISSLGNGGYSGVPGANVTHGDAAIPGSYYGEIIDAIRNGFTITVTDDFSRINVNISIGKLNPVTSKEGGIYSFNPTASSFLIPTTGYFGVTGNISAGGGGDKWYYGFPGVGPALQSGDQLSRGEYVAAAASFGIALVDVFTLGSGGALRSAGTTTVKVGTRAFFSGAGTEAQALSKGLTTLGQTRAGQNLTKLTADMPYYPGSQAYEMWGRLSTQWAKGASGEVHVFQNAANGVDVLSIWKVYEYPALKANPNVTNIIFHY
jgi:RHS repeat-associated protein